MRQGDQLFAGPALHRLPAVHDVDFIRPFAEHLQVVADQQNGGVVVLVEPRQQADNLRLSRWLHGVGRLIGDQQARLVGQGDGNHHLLALAFGQLIGEAAHGVFVIFNPDAVQQLDGPPLAPAKSLPPAPFVGPAGDTLDQLLADALRGIEARLRLLEYH